MIHKSKTWALLLFVALGIAYFLVIILLPTNESTMVHYHLTATRLRLLDLTVILPLLAIWSAAYYGFSRVTSYAGLITKARDGRGMAKIGWGLGIFAYGQLLAAIISNILQYFAQRHARFMPTATIISNYDGLIVPFIAFLFIGEGARNLSEIVKKRPSHRSIQAMATLLVILGVGYCYLVFNNVTVNPLKVASSARLNYYLPTWLILFTIVMPYILMWFTGMVGAMDLMLYQKKTPGILYKRSLAQISIGVTFLTVTWIILQYITTLSARLLQLKIGSLLLVIYPLLVLISLGYISIALGAKNLQRIEEV